jgi:hypothetical protein
MASFPPEADKKKDVISINHSKIYNSTMPKYYIGTAGWSYERIKIQKF